MTDEKRDSGYYTRDTWNEAKNEAQLVEEQIAFYREQRELAAEQKKHSSAIKFWAMWAAIAALISAGSTAYQIFFRPPGTTELTVLPAPITILSSSQQTPPQVPSSPDSSARRKPHPP